MEDIDEIEKQYLESLMDDLDSEVEPRKPDNVVRECLIDERNNEPIDEPNNEDDEYEKTIKLSLNMYNKSIEKILEESFEESLNKIMKEMEKEHELEQKKIERTIKLTNIINIINKIQKYDNQNTILKLILDIINNYINCHFDLYNIEPDDYNNILKEMKKYRINPDDFLYFKKIFDILL